MEFDRKLLCKSGTSDCCSVPACKMNHTNRATCKLDRGCSRLYCMFNHSVDLCRFKPICTNNACTFRHTLEQKSADNGQKSNCNSSSKQDLTSVGIGQRTRSSSRPDQDVIRRVGIFWDIENCAIPRQKSACEVIAHIRKYFVTQRNHREFEFMIACDTTRLLGKVCDDINKAGEVTLAHVNGTSKNAADEKLRERMKIFVEAHRDSGPMMLVLCSGDIDFVNDLRGYKNRELVHIVLLHSRSCSRQFQIGWDETYVFDEFCNGTISNTTAGGPKPNQPQPKATNAAAAGGSGNVNVGWGAAAQAAAATQHASAPKPGSSKPKTGPGGDITLAMTGFPESMHYGIVRAKLKPHADQVDGIVTYVRAGVAYLTFRSQSSADHAIELFNGMKVFGGTLTVSRHYKPIPFENGREYDDGKRKAKDSASVPAPAAKTEAHKVKKQEVQEDEEESCSIQ